MMIREVKIEDAEQILEIYNYYVKNTLITFSEDLWTLEMMEDKITETLKKFPFLIYEEKGKILGFTYAYQFRVKSAYRFTVESTIYMKKGEIGRGLGSKLYKALIAKLVEMKVHSIFGVITIPNIPSVALHERLGFKRAGTLREVGYKFDKWSDVGYWQLILD